MAATSPAVVRASAPLSSPEVGAAAPSSPPPSSEAVGAPPRSPPGLVVAAACAARSPGFLVSRPSPGDYGFDPLGLGKDPAFLKWYREAELIHGRWAMAAVVGIFVGQAWSGIPWFEARPPTGAIAPFSFGTLLGTQLLLMGWVESKRWVDFFNPDPVGLPRRQVLRSSLLRRHPPGRRLHSRRGQAGEAQAGGDQACPPRHAGHAHILLEAGQGKTPLGALGL
ncbi:unnamed protein product [Spirodela intermedia]|uniref:Chlorophyll a-b binding protein, chloroplastic n=1 Tax=Spirodela intermedia TaxID=51605 RepID=A0A7I8IQQ7_SPIIN|nr:unnamed protein product [Spirodela intermedia]CAA6659472.1 unnamed protein product [Spirodela intermedia]